MANGAFTTEDVLVSFLPLVRQVIEAHAADRVAPLEGVDSLHLAGQVIWFEEAARREKRLNWRRLQKMDQKSQAGVEVLEEHRRVTDIGTGKETVENRAVAGDDRQTISKPMYLPNYVCWEQRIGHHDELTDVFGLGMILASLACGLDLSSASEVDQFASNRSNLFRLCPGLHPVLAKAIVRMTELSRRDRPGDLQRLLRSLENYRSYDVDFEYDLQQEEGFAQRDLRGKQQIILGKLQQRLFELSRRNRLLHFKPAMNFLNLTQASVPLSFSAEHIRADQILTWGGKFAKRLLSGSAVCLNEYANFDEVLYAAPTLDRLRTEALRDKAEYGFSQLKLSVCFLRWADLKSKPPELYDSPLVLLPVELKKKKGVRDTYWLELVSPEAEINPVVRYQFRQLYDIHLPERIDLTETDLDSLHKTLVEQISRSDQTVDVRKVERPRIDLLHEKARRRLDMYRRRARVAGRGVRQFMDLDYSYDAANFRPLGLQLFSTHVVLAETQLRTILRENPSPRRFAVTPDSAPVVEKERQFYSLRDSDGDNPHHWEFDLCRVTLGNLKYRKMTLVKDYEQLLAEDRRSEAFESAFSLTAPTGPVDPVPATLDERYQVVPCDPTQASAISLARSGQSYIIQGPPGTGKSQTITNLIADFVARDQRVLFVCEKRAAIDVVHQRLKERGLADLCCLIHDSQADKKEFVMDLKEVSERSDSADVDGWPEKRRRLLDELHRELEPLEGYMEDALEADDAAGLSTKQLLYKTVEMRSHMPSLSPMQQEALPLYGDWIAHRDQIVRLIERLGDIQSDGILANHPLAVLSPRVASMDEPMRWLADRIEVCDSALADVRESLEESGADGSLWQTVGQVGELLDFARKAEPLIRRGLYALLQADAGPAQKFDQLQAAWREGQADLDEATERTKHWRTRFSSEDLAAALDQARRLEGRLLSFLNPAWWRLRKAMHASYNFGAHPVRPSWVRVLENLQQYHAAEAEHGACVARLAEFLRVSEDGVEPLCQTVIDLRRGVPELSAPMAELHAELLSGGPTAPDLSRLAEAVASWQRLEGPLRELLDDPAPISLDDLGNRLMLMEESLDELPDFLRCLSSLGELPEKLQDAFRSLPLRPVSLEAAIVGHTLDEVLRRRDAVRHFDGKLRDRQVQRLGVLYDTWQDTNAAAVREIAQEAYRGQRRLATTPAAQLTDEQKDQKKLISRGWRELSHEFGKQMRYKPIRDLVAGESGQVVRALKPIWLMSPLSVSDTLPLGEEEFDVVIFDEASQITLEEAIPSLFRGRQAIVVGDEMQLPPTNFFSAKSGDEDDLFTVMDEDGEAVEYDLSCNSFLNHAARNLPSVMLGWHYRSRSESLISFSNCAFYQGQLLTVPDEDTHSQRLDEILVCDPADGERYGPVLMDRAVSFHFVENGIYDQRRNRSEADYIAHLTRSLMQHKYRPSIGIVAFSEAQQDEIERALDRLANKDEQFRTALDAELEREDDGQFVGLLVKNLENIQGDERDVIIMSVCYGHQPDGKMRMNFGPINQTGGEKRLNVAFSRARHHMALVSSIRHADIRNDYNDGARCLKNYLRYAAVTSVNDLDAARQVLDELAVRHRTVSAQQHAANHPVARELADWLVGRGYEVDLDVGLSHFRCDMAVRARPGEGYAIGVLLDSDRYYSQRDPLERELLKPKLLRDFGWRLTSVFTKDYFEDPEGVRERLLREIEGQSPHTDSEAIEVYRQHVATMLAEVKPAPRVDVPAPVEPPSPGSETSTAPRPQGETSAGDGQLAENMPCYLEFVRGSSSKFWEITLSGDRYSVRFGRIGTTGQEQTKAFSSPGEARRQALRALDSKLAKGYSTARRAEA